MPNSQNFYADVLIVTVTDVEKDAVFKAFYEATHILPQAVTVENRVYQNLGLINDLKVFMAYSKMGQSEAQLTVQKAIDALTPHAVIMVGIAFGVDDTEQAIGDILVSRDLMSYELQKVRKNGRITPRGGRVPSSGRLDNYLDSAASHWRLKGNTPKVSFGLVLSGSKLIDNLSYRDSLKKLEPEFIGGEMEGGGLYVSCEDAKVDWILIKAVCDWADGNKSVDKEQNQQLAAKNAAEFVVYALEHASLERPENSRNGNTFEEKKH